MHIAATFGLLCALGGLDFIRGMLSDEGAFALPAAGASKLMLLITGSVYTYICVQSFIHARKYVHRQTASILYIVLVVCYFMYIIK